MFIEQLPAGAIATAILFSPGIHGAGRPDFVENAAVEVAVPFPSTQSLKIFGGDVQAYVLRQQYLEGSSALNVPVSFRIEDDVRVEDHSPAVLVQNLRRLSGFTWAQISMIFGVSSRAPYHWTSGKMVSVKNHQRLGEVVAALQYIDRGAVDENRNLLLGDAQNGQTFLDLLCDGEYELVRELAGKGAGRPHFGHELTADSMNYNVPNHWGHSVETATGADASEILPVNQPKLRRVKARRKKA